MPWKSVKPIQKGDLVKLKVPPFNIGLVIDVGPGAHLGGFRGDQLLAVMWQGWDELMKVSGIPYETSRSVDKFLNLKDTYFNDRDRPTAKRSLGFHQTKRKGYSLHHAAANVFRSRQRAHDIIPHCHHQHLPTGCVIGSRPKQNRGEVA